MEGAVLSDTRVGGFSLAFFGRALAGKLPYGDGRGAAMTKTPLVVACFSTMVA